MICDDCGGKEAFAKGLCQTCYARARRKNGKKLCSVDGCGLPAVGKGLCSKHAQRAKRQANASAITDLPGEEWRDINGHPGWMISIMGRVKSLRGMHERLIVPRVINGSLFVDDRANGSFAIHLQVLKTFRPESTGDHIFIDGDRLNPSLENLKWDTRQDKLNRAIAMAEASPCKWGPDFADYWRGNRSALDDFFADTKDFLLRNLYKKCDSYKCWYRLDIEEVAHQAIVKMFFQIHSTIKTLDNLRGYALTLTDTVLATHWKYAKYLFSDVTYTEHGEESRIDKSTWRYPSAELTYIKIVHNEECRNSIG